MARSAASTQSASVPATSAYDELTYARVEALLTINLCETELVSDPRDPAYTYPLSKEQREMLSHAAHLTLGSIERAMKAMEASR